jgi:hypothetical protein
MLSFINKFKLFTMPYASEVKYHFLDTVLVLLSTPPQLGTLLI